MVGVSDDGDCRKAMEEERPLFDDDDDDGNTGHDGVWKACPKKTVVTVVVRRMTKRLVMKQRVNALAGADVDVALVEVTAATSEVLMKKKWIQREMLD